MTDLLQKIENLKRIIAKHERKYYMKDVKNVISEFENNINIVKIDEKLMSYLAILYLYDNESERTYHYLKKAFALKQTLQTAVNLAYFYITEEDDSENKVIKILENFLIKENNSYIPYSLLAECYFEIKNYSKAEINLKKSISKKSNFINLFNLAVILFKQSEFIKSIDYFEKAKEYANKNDLILIRYNILICNLFLNKEYNMLEELDYILKNDVDEINEILDIAKLYLILNKFEKAFEIYNNCNYYLSSNWFSEKLYCLYKLNNLEKFNLEYNSFISNKEEDIKENREDSDFSVEYENDLMKEIEKIKSSYENILNDKYEIERDFDFYIKSECYYFGCIMHDNEYEI